MQETDYDVIVIGGGHNGLTAAAYMARMGRRVAVLESRESLGGFCASLSNVPDAPGFVMNPYAMDHVLTNIPPTVDDELNLAAEGLRWIHADPFYSYLDPDGGSIAFCRNVGRTLADIRRYSPTDAAQYERFNDIMTSLWRTVYPYLQGHPKRVRPRALAHILRHAATERGKLASAARMMLSSPGAIIEEWFTSRQMRAALACFAVATMSALDEPGTGIILSMMAIQHEWGVRRPVGGNQSFSEALACAARRHGATIRTRARVAGIELASGSVCGVRLDDGATLSAPSVMSALDPWTTVNHLLPEKTMPDNVYRELKGMGVLRNNISAFKGDVAISAPLDLARHRRDDVDLAGTVMLIAPDLEYVRRSTNAGLRGQLTDEIPLWFSAPSATDRSLVPPGSDGEALYVYLPAVPYTLEDGDWEYEKDKHLGRCMNILEDYAPGINASTIGARVTSPVDLEQESGLHRGNLFHVDMSLNQFGPWRPTPSLSGYRTPVPGLFLGGAGSHPMGTLSGWCGRSAARELLRKP